MSAELLSVRISVDYPKRPGALQDACFQMEAGEILGLVGASGSGKSTLALTLLMLLKYRGGRARGEIQFQGRDIMQCSERELRSLRGREIGYVPQSPHGALNPALTIESQFREAWRAHARGSMEMLDFLRLLESVSLPPERAFLKRYPGQLSVGQAQRVLIAMAMLHRPALLIADEPTSALDPITQSEILQLFQNLNARMGTAILYISHDLLSVASLCHRIGILCEGRVVEIGETARVFRTPSHAYTQRLVGAVPALAF